MSLGRDKSRKMKLEKIDSIVESMFDSVEEEEELNFIGKTRTQTVKAKLQFKKKEVKQTENQSSSCKSTQDQRTPSRKSRASKKILENAEESRSDEQTYENNFNPHYLFQ